MKLDLKDRSNYLRGMLLLIGKDNKIENNERELLNKLGDKLGFDKRFVSTAIDELLENEYINETAPEFSHVPFAESFIKDGLNLAFSDDDINPDELSYLKSTASANGLHEEWFSSQIKSFLNNGKFDKLHVESYL